jgi:hypothetical protein
VLVDDEYRVLDKVQDLARLGKLWAIHAGRIDPAT